ncbi:MAG: carbon storage regulator CsrA [Thermodesulfobacteriota bacterium]|nr:carbon storage regulator CsrA [Thermodesulfobacteriota bacterium]
MLVLTRKVDEKVRIGDNIVVTVVQLEKGSVKLGFEAPHHVAVHRNEVYEKIRNENVRSAGGAPDDIEDAARIWQQRKDGE